MAAWGFWHLNPIHYLLLGDNAFALIHFAMDGESLQQKATDKGRKYRQLQDLQRHKGG